MRFPLEVYGTVHSVYSADKPVTVRVWETDWVEGGWDIDQIIEFAKVMERRKCSAIHVSTGGLDINQKMPVGPSYQVPFALAVKAAVKIPVMAVVLITDFNQAEAILVSGDADFVGLARTILYNLRWPWHAAAHFGETIAVSPQFLRSQPKGIMIFLFAHLFELLIESLFKMLIAKLHLP